MYKVIETTPSTFQVKELDAAGNSIKLFPDLFKSVVDAQAYIDSLESGEGAADGSRGVVNADADAEKKSTDDTGTSSEDGAGSTSGPIKMYKVLGGFMIDLEKGDQVGLDSENEIVKEALEKGILEEMAA